MAERKSWDSAYKYLFSSRQVFHQFLTRFVDEDFVQGLAVDDVELIDKSFVSDELLDRESDIIYKVDLPGREVYVYVLLEFQSSPDKTIPVRMLLYYRARHPTGKIRAHQGIGSGDHVPGTAGR